MLAAYASAALICAGSLLAGHAVLALCSSTPSSSFSERNASSTAAGWLAGPVGLAVLVTAAGIAAGLGARGTAIAIALGATTLAAVAVLITLGDLPSIERPGTPQKAHSPGRSALARVPSALVAALLGALLAALFASLPFLAAGRVGILGVGLVNDDMASHLLLASWLDERFIPEPGLVGQGYPQGPHALAAGLAAVPGVTLVQAFAGLVIAIPALTAVVAAGALGDVRPLPRVGLAALVALPYLAAAYLAQEAFKEPILALFLLGFALRLPAVVRPRDAIPLGVIAAGVLYVYSFPGLVWLGGALTAWVLLSRRSPRELLIPVAAALGILLVLAALDLDRLTDFTNFRALDPSRANEGGLGNLRGHLSPLEALAVWPTSEFRLPAGAGSLPAIAFYAGAALAGLALLLGLPRWIRRHGPAIPAALAAAILIYGGARVFGTVYTSAKALAIASPLILLISLGGLLGDGAGEDGPRGGPRDADRGGSRLADSDPSGVEKASRGPAAGPSKLLALVVAAAAALSSFLVLRQAPVGPDDHAGELAQLRPLVAGERVLFLGRDNFVLWELRGSRPFVHVRNFYDPYYAEPNPRIRDSGLKFDFDSVSPKTLGRFRFVITTRAAYASGRPPGYNAVRQTANYVLWKRLFTPRGRRTLDEGSEPGATLHCHGQAPRRALAAVVSPAPVRADEGGSRLRLRAGDWYLSLQYDATRPLRVRAPGLDTSLPANLDFRGPGPYWPAGRLTVGERGPVEVTTTVEDPPLIGSLLGAKSAAHVTAIAATPITRSHPRLLERACGEYVDWYVPAHSLPPLRRLQRPVAPRSRLSFPPTIEGNRGFGG